MTQYMQTAPPHLIVSQVSQGKKVNAYICQLCGAIIKKQHCDHCEGLPYGLAIVEGPIC